MARTEQHIVYEKVREVYNFMVNGSKQRKEIVHFFTKKWSDEGFWSKKTLEVSKHRTIDNYIRKTKHSFLNFEKECESEKGRILARLDDLYSKSIKIQDYKGALSVVKEIAEITGNKIQKVDHTTKGEVIQQLPPIILQTTNTNEHENTEQ